MSQLIHSIKWSKSFSWTAPQDCWIVAFADTRETESASQVKLNNEAVLSVLQTGTTIDQASAFFPCKKGDVISKVVNGDSTALFRAYAMRV